MQQTEKNEKIRNKYVLEYEAKLKNKRDRATEERHALRLGGARKSKKEEEVLKGCMKAA